MTAWTLLRCDARLDGPTARICPARFQTTQQGADATREASTYGWTTTPDGLRCPTHRGHVNTARPPEEALR